VRLLILLFLIPSLCYGQITFQRTYGDTFDVEYGYAVQQCFDEGYIMVGSTRGWGAGGHDVYLVKTDAYGDTLWTKTYGGPIKTV